MIFQWQLFVLLIIIALFTPAMGMYREVNVYGNRQLRYNWGPVLILVIPMIYMAGTRSKTMPDFWGYIGIFKRF